MKRLRPSPVPALFPRSSIVAARTLSRAASVTAPKVAKFRFASIRLTAFAPHAVGSSSCTASSSQKHTAQTWNVPGGGPSSVRKAQRGLANFEVVSSSFGAV